MTPEQLREICDKLGPGIDLALALSDRVVMHARPDQMTKIMEVAITAGPEIAAELQYYLETAAQDADVWKSAKIGEVWEENR